MAAAAFVRLQTEVATYLCAGGANLWRLLLYRPGFESSLGGDCTGR